MVKHLRGSGVLLALAAWLLAGCAGAAGGVRPVIAMDGQSMNVHDPVENGRALLVTGQYGLAIDALSRVLHDDPNNPRTLTLLAEAYDRLHRYDLADRYHGEALRVDPNFVAALNNWGFSYLVRGDKARAVGLLERAAAVKQDHPVVAANLRLAAGSATAASQHTPSVLPVAEATGDIQVSEHVVAVRRTGKLVRLAPGVQLLVTRPPTAAPMQSAGREPKPGSAALTMFPGIGGQSAPAAGDPTTRLLGALQRILDPSPFKFFPEVDDFSRQWQADSGAASEPTRSVATAG
jgi:tetratricopeptide (TPR) repeat protein